MKQFFDTVRPLFGRMNQGQVDGCNTLVAAMDGQPLTFAAYMLGTTFHETAHTMEPITEYGRRSYFDKYEPGTRIGARLGNTVEGDGFRYRGRGYVQITGRRNYTLAERVLGLDLVDNPDLALDPDVAARILIKGCTAGWFTGKALRNYLPGDYVGARKVVNGTDRAQKIAGYAERFEKALRVEGWA